LQSQLSTVVAPALDGALGGTAMREYTARQQQIFIGLLCSVKAAAAVHRSWQLSHTLYAPGDAVTAPTRQALRLFEWLRTFRTRLAAQTEAPVLAEQVVAQLMACVVEAVRDAEEPLWRHVGTLPSAGIVQLVLDLRWMQVCVCVCVCVCVVLLTDATQEAAAALGWSSAKVARQLDALVPQSWCTIIEHSHELTHWSAS
jgi:hypothetical protein